MICKKLVYTVNSRFKKDPNLQIHSHTTFSLADQFLNSVHRYFPFSHVIIKWSTWRSKKKLSLDYEILPLIYVSTYISTNSCYSGRQDIFKQLGYIRNLIRIFDQIPFEDLGKRDFFNRNTSLMFICSVSDESGLLNPIFD